ncbi:RRXRR domain-containing protein [Methylacidiphilum sp. Yel]|uniref:RRXRR domain-containing protein n=1 Tax=Methylacidiphilum sp. Yel TaxID=1847730 RepID=UPI001ABCA971
MLDKRLKHLMPCSEKWARLLLSCGRARIYRMVSFTIRLWIAGWSIPAHTPKEASISTRIPGP